MLLNRGRKNFFYGRLFFHTLLLHWGSNFHGLDKRFKELIYECGYFKSGYNHGVDYQKIEIM